MSARLGQQVLQTPLHSQLQTAAFYFKTVSLQRLAARRPSCSTPLLVSPCSLSTLFHSRLGIRKLFCQQAKPLPLRSDSSVVKASLQQAPSGSGDQLYCSVGLGPPPVSSGCFSDAALGTDSGTERTLETKVTPNGLYADVGPKPSLAVSGHETDAPGASFKQKFVSAKGELLSPSALGRSPYSSSTVLTSGSLPVDGAEVAVSAPASFARVVSTESSNGPAAGAGIPQGGFGSDGPVVAGASFLLLVGLAAAAVGAFWQSWRMKHRPLEVVAGASNLNRKFLERCKAVSEPYRPTFGLTNRHVETIFASFFRTLPPVRYRRECLLSPCGGSVALDWPVGGDPSDEAMWRQELPPSAPILILLPGLTGGSQDTYVRHMLVRARKAGFRPVVFNSRGCGDSPVTSPQFYSASFTEDTRMVIAHVRKGFPQAPLVAAGWSLGANILVRYLGQEGERTPLSAAVSLCNPFDLVAADEDFQKGFNRIYNRKLADSLRRIFAKHSALFENIGGEYNIPLAANAKTVRDFDEGLTRVSFGYPTVAAYYHDASSSRLIKDVRIPLLCIQAMDDPIAPERGIPRKDIEENSKCLLLVTPGGGHLGWCAGPEAPFRAPWTDPVVMDFVSTVVHEKPPAVAGIESRGADGSREERGKEELLVVR